MASPIPGAAITQAFGVIRPDLYPQPPHRHEGVDFHCAIGTPVHACANGLVMAIGSPWGADFGHDSPLIRHKVIVNGQPVLYYVMYAHMSHEDLRPGQVVTKGQLIGRSGNEGHVTGPHLHLEAQLGRLWRRGGGVNPIHLLNA